MVDIARLYTRRARVERWIEHNESEARYYWGRAGYLARIGDVQGSREASGIGSIFWQRAKHHWREYANLLTRIEKIEPHIEPPIEPHIDPPIIIEPTPEDPSVEYIERVAHANAWRLRGVVDMVRGEGKITFYWDGSPRDFQMFRETLDLIDPTPEESQSYVLISLTIQEIEGRQTRRRIVTFPRGAGRLNGVLGETRRFVDQWIRSDVEGVDISPWIGRYGDESDVAVFEYTAVVGIWLTIWLWDKPADYGEDWTTDKWI